MITRGTTPTVIFNLKNEEGEVIDLSNYTIYITIKDVQDRTVELSNNRITFNNDFSFEAILTQEETLKLSYGRLKVQLRAKKEDIAIASTISFCNLQDILKGGEI